MTTITAHNNGANHRMAAADLLDDLLHDDKYADGASIPTTAYLPTHCMETTTQQLLCEAKITAQATAMAAERGCDGDAKRLPETAIERLSVLMEHEMDKPAAERIANAERLINAVEGQAVAMSDAMGQGAVAQITRYAVTEVADDADAAEHVRAALLSRRVKQDIEAWQLARARSRHCHNATRPTTRRNTPQ